MPRRPSVFASHATAFTGEPSAAAPAPVATISPFSQYHAAVNQIHFGWLDQFVTEYERATGGVVRHGVLNFIFQSWMRESTISKHAITPSVAASTSALVTPGPIKSFLRQRQFHLRRVAQSFCRSESPHLRRTPYHPTNSQNRLVNVEHTHHRLAGHADFLPITRAPRDKRCDSIATCT